MWTLTPSEVGCSVLLYRLTMIDLRERIGFPSLLTNDAYIRISLLINQKSWNNDLAEYSWYEIKTTIIQRTGDWGRSTKISAISGQLWPAAQSAQQYPTSPPSLLNLHQWTGDWVWSPNINLLRQTIWPSGGTTTTKLASTAPQLLQECQNLINFWQFILQILRPTFQHQNISEV